MEHIIGIEKLQLPTAISVVTQEAWQTTAESLFTKLSGGPAKTHSH